MNVKNFVILLFTTSLILLFQNATIPGSNIKGELNGVQKFPKGYLVWGWVCVDNKNVSVPVNLYITNSNGQKSLWKSVVANKSIGNNASTFTKICGTTNTNHRFVENLTYEEVLKYNGSILSAEATDNGFKKLLPNDRNFSQKIVLDDTSSYTKYGWVKGEVSPWQGNQNVIQFKGIPYAHPPLGGHRWAKPQPPAPWTSEKMTTSFSDACAQADGHLPKHIENNIKRSEDCLYLNVWKAKGRTKMPVVVYIHGGGFKGGYSGLPDYDGTYIASQNNVFVSFNYRVGMFGFFSHPYLTQLNRNDVNFGLADQELALNWVKENISEFGGDPNNITIVGSSAGGASVAIWMANNKAQGLFHRAIIESGGGSLTSYLENKETAARRGHQMINEELFEMAVNSQDPLLRQKVSACRGASPSDQCLEQLLFNTPTQYLQTTKYFNRYLHPASTNNSEFIKDPITGRNSFSFFPFLDNSYVTGGTLDIFKCGQQKDLPLIIGSMGWEADIVESSINKNPQNYYYGMNPNDLSRVYNISNKTPLLAERVYTDRTFAVPSRLLASYHAKKNENTFWYFFNYIADNMAHEKGAQHSSLDLFTLQSLFTHPGLQNYLPTTNKDRAVAKVWSGYWLNFFRGNFDSKNGLQSSAASGLASWQPFLENKENRLFINNYGKIVSSSPLKREFGDEHTRNINALLTERYDYVENSIFPDQAYQSSCQN